MGGTADTTPRTQYGNADGQVFHHDAGDVILIAKDTTGGCSYVWLSGKLKGKKFQTRAIELATLPVTDKGAHPGPPEYPQVQLNVGQPAELYVQRQYRLEEPSWLKKYRAKCKGGKTEVVEEKCAFPRCPQNDKTRFPCDVQGCKRAAHIECYRAYAHHAHGYKHRVSKAMFDIPVACYECHLTLAYEPPGSSASGLSKYPPHAPFR